MPDQFGVVTVNGASIKSTSSSQLLSDFIREDLETDITHVGCEHGIGVRSCSTGNDPLT